MFVLFARMPLRKLASSRLFKTLYFVKAIVSLGFTEGALDYKEPCSSRHASESSDSFRCCHCHLHRQSQELCSLWASLSTLETTFSSLSKQVASLRVHLGQSLSPDKPSSNTTAPANLNNLIAGVVFELTSSTKPILVPPPHAQDLNQKFNIVMYELKESLCGTHKTRWQSEDLEKVESVITSLGTSVSLQSVRDCYRLGAYKHQHTRPRPINVKLNRASDVSTLLSNRSSLSKLNLYSSSLTCPLSNGSFASLESSSITKFMVLPQEPIFTSFYWQTPVNLPSISHHQLLLPVTRKSVTNQPP